ncbi:MAG: hypothetical protein IPH20_04175 [Bacteroidales bacterium]|nr:hypothetical protein [Bacteroidales bacterium]
MKDEKAERSYEKREALKGRNIITMGEAKRSPWILKPKRKQSPEGAK